MKVVILAGGFGTRLSEETTVKPKPMVEIGGKPILWHIMKIFSHYGLNDFVICLGYKGYMIKEFFSNYFIHMSDVTFDMRLNKMKVHNKYAEDWRVTLVDTGQDTGTGGRIRRIARYVKGETFALTYGDGVGDVDIASLINYHRSHGKLATVTAVQPPGRYGLLRMDESGSVTSFEEKPAGDGGWINGGFFVLEPGVLSYVDGDQTVWEREPMEGLAGAGQLSAFRHYGFWRPMDTLRDKLLLENLWHAGEAPWHVWSTGNVRAL